MQRLLEYLDGDMGSAEARELKQHLDTCPPCVNFVQSYRATPDLCRRHLAKQMPEELVNHLKSFLRDKLREP
jgi:anti-sigma factor RsiW